MSFYDDFLTGLEEAKRSPLESDHWKSLTDGQRSRLVKIWNRHNSTPFADRKVRHWVDHPHVKRVLRLEPGDRIPRALRRLTDNHMNTAQQSLEEPVLADREYDMDQSLNDAINLYRASVRRTPALMMETVAVDSNRGVTSRGNSLYDRYASPQTREKVLQSRMQEIESFALKIVVCGHVIGITLLLEPRDER